LKDDVMDAEAWRREARKLAERIREALSRLPENWPQGSLPTMTLTLTREQAFLLAEDLKSLYGLDPDDVSRGAGDPAEWRGVMRDLRSLSRRHEHVEMKVTPGMAGILARDLEVVHGGVESPSP
jgi:hypothetical protein